MLYWLKLYFWFFSLIHIDIFFFNFKSIPRNNCSSGIKFKYRKPTNAILVFVNRKFYFGRDLSGNVYFAQGQKHVSVGEHFGVEIGSVVDVGDAIAEGRNQESQQLPARNHPRKDHFFSAVVEMLQAN